MNMRFAAPAVFVLGLALAGCGTPESKLIGKWKGEVVLSDKAKSDPMSAVAQGMVSMLDPQLDLKPDHTFTLYLSIMPIDGTWSYDGATVTLTPNKYGGVDPEEVKKKMAEGKERWKDKAPSGAMEIAKEAPAPGTPMTVKISEDWKTLSLEGQSSAIQGIGDIVFKKV